MNKEDEILEALKEIKDHLGIGLPSIMPLTIASSCSKCGLAFTDAMGNPIVTGYVCPNADCPCGLGGTQC